MFFYCIYRIYLKCLFFFAESNPSAQYIGKNHLVKSESRLAKRDKKQRRSLRLRSDKRSERDA